MKKSNLTAICSVLIITLFIFTDPAFGDDALYIDENGNVGIGTSNPYAPLHIYSTSDLTTGMLYLHKYTNAENKSFRIHVGAKAAGSWPFTVDNSVVTLQASGAHAMNIAFASGNSEKIRILTNGNVGIGTTSPSTELTVYGTKGIQWSDDYLTWRLGRNYTDYASTAYAHFTTGSGGTHQNLALGTLYAYNYVSASSYYTHSDESIKKNIQPIPNALDKILQLKGVNFEWEENGERSVGLVAQDVEKVFPELVKTMDVDAKASKAVAYGNLIAPLIEAVKELKNKNDSLVEMITALEDEKDSEVDMLIELIEQLKNRVEELEKNRG